MKLRIALLSTLFGAVAVAGTISLTVTPDVTIPAAGLFSYSYNVTNDISSSENLFSFTLAETGPLTSIISPTGWTSDNLSTPGYIIWTSQDQSTDLTSGSITIFGFNSSLPPGTQQFLGFGSDPISGFPTGDLTAGFTFGPTASTVPEPVSVVLFACGIIFVSAQPRLNRSARAAR